MKRALELAKKAFDEGEVPVGALIVYKDQIISEAHNQTEFLLDPSAHAELLAIRKACQVLGNWRLSNCTLYTTLEPCAMCAGAIIQARLKKVVWGAPDIRCGGGVLLDGRYEIHSVEYEKNIMADASAQLLRDFFKRRRHVRGDDRAAERETAQAGT